MVPVPCSVPALKATLMFLSKKTRGFSIFSHEKDCKDNYFMEFKAKGQHCIRELKKVFSKEAVKQSMKMDF